MSEEQRDLLGAWLLAGVAVAIFCAMISIARG